MLYKTIIYFQFVSFNLNFLNFDVFDTPTTHQILAKRLLTLIPFINFRLKQLKTIS